MPGADLRTKEEAPPRISSGLARDRRASYWLLKVRKNTVTLWLPRIRGLTRTCELDKLTPVYFNMSSKSILPSKIGNKQKRQELVLKHKRAQEKLKREERFRRKKEEDKNPKLRVERRKRNIPATIDRKRQWDSVDSEDEDGLGLSVDVERIKRRKHDQELEENGLDEENSIEGQREDARFDDDRDSMIDSGTDTDGGEAEKQKKNPQAEPTSTERATSPTRSTASTNLSLIPEHLAERFPSLLADAPRTPKTLITTSINSNLHYEAELLTTLFPNAVYIPRSAHRYSHKYSVREISRFASNRNYTAVVVLMEGDGKRPTGLDFVHLPNGPM